ncbi:hypothetical protein AURDEDRAFT_113301 [Auricularia subglabra TFB-10046 SS5]|nr:hypothetical protein AURDEDRAFT_113301 [Auricularia subglabra TFB-10046 SS5]
MQDAAAQVDRAADYVRLQELDELAGYAGVLFVRGCTARQRRQEEMKSEPEK